MCAPQRVAFVLVCHLTISIAAISTKTLPAKLGELGVMKQEEELDSAARRPRSAHDQQARPMAPRELLLNAAQAQPYKCAKFCVCSSVSTLLEDSGGPGGLSVLESAIEQEMPAAWRKPSHFEARLATANLTRAKCESGQFSDVLTIDRRTQIIHISLPQDNTSDESPLSSQDHDATSSQQSGTRTKASANQKATIANKMNESATTTTTTRPADKFRMPRLAQFSLLREIVIINLKFEVCDSEVFKRGQKLLRLKWNSNQLSEISRDCFRYLDKLLDLNLDYNRLSELESALFSNLVHLRHLSLAHNRLSELAAHQFANLSQLVTLNLVGNLFKSINLNLLEPMQNSLRLLVLARNQIKAFVYLTSPTSAQLAAPRSANSSGKSQPQSPPPPQQQQQQQIFGGAFFKKLIKLNVDFNKFERIKMLQLHRFFNVKFLSIRGNQINAIRDRAFDGRKLIELNLAQNKLQMISRCAFCNATIKRLILAHNNISVPLGLAPGGQLHSAGLSPASLNAPRASASAQQLVALPDQPELVPGSSSLAREAAATTAAGPLYLSAASSASMLVLSQSIFGPLFSQLEYLDLSHNKNLANQLEFLLEPLLELQYLNLAAIGLDRALPTPNLFKNLRQLRYLNLSQNSLDQLIAETIEPLGELELLDMSRNQFNELDESFLISLDELAKLKYVNLASNPWYCSQCKISPLYDWILRSPIFNATCLAQTALVAAPSPGEPNSIGSDAGSAPGGQLDDELEFTAAIAATVAAESASSAHSDDSNLLSLGFIYRQSGTSSHARGPQQYSLLSAESAHSAAEPQTELDFDLILSLFDGSSLNSDEAGGSFRQLSGPNYQLAPSSPLFGLDQSQAAPNQLARRRRLSEQLLKSLATSEDDESVAQTVASLVGANRLLEAENNELVLSKFFQGQDFCLKCEYPSELRAFSLHELAPTDFKYCAGSAPRFAASEPRIGLTLAIVIIGALFCVIIIVIVMYRKKSNAYYPNEELTDQLESGAGAARKPGQPVLSVSSDLDHQYGGDATDYSSPPMSQSYESYSQEEDEDDDLDEDEEEEEEEDEEDDEEAEEEEDEASMDEDEDVDGEDEDDGQDDGGDGAGEGRKVDDAHETGASSHVEPAANDNGAEPSGARTSHARHGHEEQQPAPGKQQQQQHANEAHHVTISTANDKVHAFTPTGSGHKQTQQKPSTERFVSIVPVSMREEPSSSSLKTSQPNQREMAHGRRQQSHSSQNRQFGAALEQINAANLIEQMDSMLSDGHHSASNNSAHDKSGPLAQLSAADLRSQQQKQLAGLLETNAEASSKSRQAIKLSQLANVAGSLQEQQSRAKSAKSHEFAPASAHRGRPGGLRQSKTTATPEPDSSLALGEFPPLPVDFRSPESSPRGPPRPLQQAGIVSPVSVPVPVPPTRPKHKQHRQSSEHSTAGSVSFELRPQSSSQRPGKASERRGRLMSQTICVESVKPAASFSRTGHTGSMRLPSNVAAFTEVKGVHDVSPEVVGKQRRRLASQRANLNGNTRAGSTLSSSSTLPDQQQPHQLESSKAPVWRPANRASMLTSKPLRRRPIDGADDEKAAELQASFSSASASASSLSLSAAAAAASPSELEREKTAQVESRQQVMAPTLRRPPARQQPMKPQQSQLQHASVIAPHSAHHRHHIKQPTESCFVVGRNGDQLGRRDSATLDDDDDDDEEEEESLDLAAQLEDLPSDLDELEVEQIHPAHTEARPRTPADLVHRSGGALESEAAEQNFGRLQLEGASQLRNSHSTHSALTQTGSRDFDI